MVSHGHVDRIRQLLGDFRSWLDPERYELLLTLNIPEPVDDLVSIWPGRIRFIRNERPQGFGTNHNAAWRQASATRLAAIDPDLRLHGDPFPALAEALTDPHRGIVSTRVLDEHGNAADHARSAPTLARLLKRYTGRDEPSYPKTLLQPYEVDWLAGLFLAMSKEHFERLGGFDESFHMYCEDVDLCLRSWNAGMSVSVVPSAFVTHPARRHTLGNRGHFQWHVRSLLQLWTRTSYRSFLQRPRGGR